MNNKKLISSITGALVVGVLTYLGYRVFKDINTLDLNDISWENIDDVYHYRYPKDREGA